MYFVGLIDTLKTIFDQNMVKIKSYVQRGYSAESCVIRLGIFSSQYTT